MRRPSPLLPYWINHRRLPLLACAALGLRAVSSAQPVAPEMQAGRMAEGGADVGSAKPNPRLPAKVDRGFLGVSLMEIRDDIRAQTQLKEGEGLIISRVAKDSPAEQSGIAPYDLLIRFDDQWVMSEKQVITLVENAGPGSEVELTTLHRGREVKTKVTLGPSPSDEARGKLPFAPEPPSTVEMLDRISHSLKDCPPLLESLYKTLYGPLFGNAPGPNHALNELATQLYTLWDEEGRIELKITGASQRLRAWDGDGKSIYEGPCDTPHQRAEIPAEALVRLESLEKQRRNLQLPVTPPSASSLKPNSDNPATPAFDSAKPE